MKKNQFSSHLLNDVHNQQMNEEITRAYIIDITDSKSHTYRYTINSSDMKLCVPGQNICHCRMRMDNSTATIVDLPDEILLTIFSKLDHIETLYSLVGVNQKLDKIACDINFTRSLAFIMKSPNGADNSVTDAMLNRFCVDIRELHRAQKKFLDPVKEV